MKKVICLVAIVLLLSIPSACNKACVCDVQIKECQSETSMYYQAITTELRYVLYPDNNETDCAELLSEEYNLSNGNGGVVKVHCEKHGDFLSIIP